MAAQSIQMEGSPGAGASAISWRGLESHLYFVNSPLKCNKRTLLGSSSFHHKLSFNKAWDLSFKSFRVKFLDAIILIPQEKPNVRESSDLCEGLSRQGEGAMHRLEIILRHCHCPPPPPSVVGMSCLLSLSTTTSNVVCIATKVECTVCHLLKICLLV